MRPKQVSVNKLLLWGLGLQGVVVCFANRKSDGFDSRMLHSHLRYDITVGGFRVLR